MVSTGFTPGDAALTTNAASQPILAEFKDQTLVAYELGGKNRFADDKIQINGAVYYCDYGSFQVSNINLNPNKASPVRTFRTIAIPVTTYGAELEFLARPWRNGGFAANFAYINAKYHDIPAEYAYLFAFDEIPGVSPFEVSTSYTHTLPLADQIDRRLSGDVHYASSHYVARVEDDYDHRLCPKRNQREVSCRSKLVRGACTTGASANKNSTLVANKRLVRLLRLFPSERREMVNATFAFARGKYSLTGHVPNLTHKRYFVQGYGTTIINDAGPSGVNATAQLNDPRTWGVLTMHF